MLRGMSGSGGGMENSSSTKRLRVGESSGDSLDTEEAIANGVTGTYTGSDDSILVSASSQETSAETGAEWRQAENCCSPEQIWGCGLPLPNLLS